MVDGSLGGGPSARERLRHLGADLVLLNRAEAHALLATPGPAGRAGCSGPLDAAALAQAARLAGLIWAESTRLDSPPNGQPAVEMYAH
ncbi:hypothetical protein [Streptomyces sp. NPDC015350]|uniref:hypothetical protein n=1 Tax=Streptomyces sp. NPDC015350 TaxID=3364955 RepID=UPI0036FBC5DC